MEESMATEQKQGNGSDVGLPARRRALRLAAGLFVGSLPSAALAQALLRTPAQTEGPFYPPNPPEQDADLTTVKGGSGVARGEITHLSGRIVDSRGVPLRDVRVEIWQCDANGRYHHPSDRSDRPLDPNFQGFGSAATGETGDYAFKTIRPVPYPGRTPHIHFRLVSRAFSPFVTQMYVAGHPQNARDGVLNSIPAGRERDAVMANFLAIKAPGGATEYTARFDIVLGVTPKQA
jgi:protocatechuate 3,4-dioxygenase beta subunit